MKINLKVWSWAILGVMFAAGTAIAQVGPPTPKTSVPSGGAQPRFACLSLNNQYTVTYHPVDRPGDSYPWAVPSTMGSWDASKRCNEIARRLEDYRKDGLQELRTDVKNNYDVVCVTTEKNNECRIVLTVPKGNDAVATRDAVFSNLTVADSGQATTAVNTYAEGGNNPLGALGNVKNIPGIGTLGNNTPNSRPLSNKGSIDLRPFLSTNDGGTATGFSRLTSVQSTPTGKKVAAPAAKTTPNDAKVLDPNRFR
jgi:hypothetical protein